MSSNQDLRFTKARAEERSGQMMDKARDKCYEAAQSVKDKTGGVVQQAGEKVKQMARSAADAVKNTFGMNNAGDEEEDDPTTYARRGC